MDRKALRQEGGTSIERCREKGTETAEKYRGRDREKQRATKWRGKTYQGKDKGKIMWKENNKVARVL